MKRFRFRLQKYFSLKQQEEKLKKLHLAQAEAFYRQQEHVLEGINHTLAGTTERLRQALTGMLDLELLVQTERYLLLQRERQERQEELLAEAGEQLEQRKQELVQTRRERRLLEHLHQKRWSAYRQELLWEEQRELDEMGLIHQTRR